MTIYRVRKHEYFKIVEELVNEQYDYLDTEGRVAAIEIARTVIASIEAQGDDYVRTHGSNQYHHKTLLPTDVLAVTDQPVELIRAEAVKWSDHPSRLEVLAVSALSLDLQDTYGDIRSDG